MQRSYSNVPVTYIYHDISCSKLSVIADSSREGAFYFVAEKLLLGDFCEHA